MFEKFVVISSLNVLDNARLGQRIMVQNEDLVSISLAGKASASAAVQCCRLNVKIVDQAEPMT